MSTHQNPFVGLRPFESTDSVYYFGRDEQTRALLEYLYRTRFLVVVGSSGSGKSSLVRAGLIPHLEAGFLVQDRDPWHIAKMKPGDQPFYNFAHALVHTVEDKPSPEQIADFAINISHKGIYAVLERIAPILAADDSNLFILVDQFEEVFRFGVNTMDSAKQGEAAAFVDLLLRLAGQEDIPVYVCLTMRSDYIGDCDVFHGLPEAMNRSQYLVPRLTRRQRREAIEGPIRLAGAAIAPRLLDRLLNDSGEYRDNLPILQHALMRTWNEWAKQKNGPVDMIHYEKIQTMARALSRHADEALNELTDEEKQLAKRLFQTLTETDAENRRIRRSIHLGEIVDITGSGPGFIMRIIEKFREDSRCFLVLSSESATDDPLVDISHESLMRQWGALGNWMDEEAESAKVYKRLAETAELKKQGKAGLYIGLDLQIALDWREREKPTKAWGKRYYKDFEAAIEFLNKSNTAHQERIEEENRQRQKSIKQKLIFVIVISLLTISIVFGVIFIEQRNESKRQTLNANYNLAKVFEQKAMNALKLGHEQNSVRYYKEAWLYMGAALKQEIDKDKLPLQPASVGALLTPGVINAAFGEKWFSPLHSEYFQVEYGFDEFVNCVGFSPDGKTLVSVYRYGTILLWDMATGKVIQTLRRRSRQVTDAAISPDGKILASGSFDRTIRLWEVASGKEIRTLRGHSHDGSSVAISPDRKTLASGSYDNTIRLWEVVLGKEIRTLRGHSRPVSIVAFSSDGKTLASGSHDNTIRLWDVSSGREIRTLTGHSGSVISVAFSPDGKTLASASVDKTIRLWEMASGKEIRTLTGHSGSVISVAFSPDGKTLASGSHDNTIRLWDVATGKEIRTLTGHSRSVISVAFSPDGKTLASASVNKTIRLWEMASGKEIRTLTGHSGSVISVAFSPDGKALTSGSRDKTIRLWDVVSGKEIRRITGHSDDVTSVAFSLDGNTLASGSMDKTIRLWEVATGKEIQRLRGHSDDVTSVAFSLDGNTLASGSKDKTIRLWDVVSGKEIRRLKGHSDTITSVAFSPDGNTLAFGSWDNTIRLFEVATGKNIRTLRSHSLPVNSVAFSPDGNTLASGSWGGTIRLWEVATGKEIRKLTGHSNDVTRVAFSPDGKSLVSGSRDNTIRLWEVATGKEIRRLIGHSDWITSVTFSPDGKTLASGSYDRSIRLWDMSIFNLFLKNGKTTPLFYTFSEGAEFFWGVQLEGFEFVPRPKDQEYDPKFKPLLDPPAQGQTKFEQILEWAKKHTLK